MGISILDTAHLCNIDLNTSTLEQEEVEARCPLCKDHKYRMYLNTQKNVFYCHNCGAHGGAARLYADLSGVDLAEARRILMDSPAVSYDFPPYYSAQEQTEPLRPLEERHRIYLDMLSMLSLSREHRADLKRRGLSDEMIDGNMYRSLPMYNRRRLEIADKLERRWGLHDVPGFYTGNGVWRLSGRYGYLIPICTKDNLIQGFQIRLDVPWNGKKYHWLSSGSRENGTRNHSYIHVVGDVNSKVVHLTEGGLKGDISSYLSGGELFVCLPGVNAVRYLKQVLQELKPDKIVECIDMDVRSNENVQSAMCRIRSICKPFARCETFYWDSQWKGIDDYLLYTSDSGAREENENV